MCASNMDWRIEPNDQGRPDSGLTGDKNEDSPGDNGRSYHPWRRNRAGKRETMKHINTLTGNHSSRNRESWPTFIRRWESNDVHHSLSPGRLMPFPFLFLAIPIPEEKLWDQANSYTVLRIEFPNATKGANPIPKFDWTHWSWIIDVPRSSQSKDGSFQEKGAI